jgi:hypothetical protein
MSDGIRSVPPAGARAVTNFDEASEKLIKNSEALRESANRAIAQAGHEIASSGDRAQRAAAHLVGAGVNAGMAVGYAVKGTVVDAGARGVGHGVAGTGVGAAGVVVGAGEETLGLGARISNAVGRGFVSIGNALNHIVGNGKTATVTEVEGQGGERLSSRLFGIAGEQYQMSADGFRAAWNSYEQSVAHAIGAGVNLGYVAGYTALAAADLAQAAVKTGEAGVLVAAQGANVIAAAGVQAAENGMEGAAELSYLAAQYSAALGKIMAKPSNGDTINVEVQQAQEVYDARLADLLKNNPQLRELPAFKDLKAQGSR